MAGHIDKEEITGTMKSNLEIVKECDNFPYLEPFGRNREEQDKYIRITADVWKLFLPDDATPHGYIPSFIVDKMPWTSDFHLTPTRKEIRLLRPTSSSLHKTCTQSIDALLDLARAQYVFTRLGEKRDESYPILGASFDVRIERSAASLFGIVTRGAHMNIFVRGGAGEIKVWIARRNARKATYPGMLDNAVAGGVAAGETPLECIIHEAIEEAAIWEGFVRERARAVGCVSWFHVSDERAGGEIGLMNPGVLYVYDMLVDTQMKLIPVDDDIQGFYLMGVREIMEAMARGEFKPACANVMMDFFIRHGIITAENEQDYVEIVARLHRKLQFPTTPPKC